MIFTRNYNTSRNSYDNCHRLYTKEPQGCTDLFYNIESVCVERSKDIKYRVENYLRVLSVFDKAANSHMCVFRAEKNWSKRKSRSFSKNRCNGSINRFKAVLYLRYERGNCRAKKKYKIIPPNTKSLTIHIQILGKSDNDKCILCESSVEYSSTARLLDLQ